MSIEKIKDDTGEIIDDSSCDREEGQESEVISPYCTSNIGSPLYYPIKYKFNPEINSMVAYFDDPLDLQAMIDASKDSCDIISIVKRALAGDVTVLNVNPNAQYMDISGMPNNLNDANKFFADSIENWDNLDPEFKALFDNDINKLKDSINDNSYMDIVNAHFNKENEQKSGDEGDAK